MLSVRAQFAQFRCTEPPRHVRPHIDPVRDVPHGSQASRHTREGTAEILEPSFQGIAVQPSDISPDAASQVPPAELPADRPEDTGIQQIVRRDQILVPQVVRHLVHAADSRRIFPATCLFRQIFDVIGQGVQPEKQTTFIFRHLVFLPVVPLPAQQGLHPPGFQIEGVVQDRLVMIDMLERKPGPVTRLPLQFSGHRVSFPFYDAGLQVIISHLQTRIPPVTVESQHSGKRPLAELGIRHQAVIGIPVGMGILVRIPQVPDDATLVAAIIQRIIKQSIVSLILRADRSTHFPIRHNRSRMEDQYARQGVASVHQTRRSLHDLYRMDRLSVYLHAMLVPPLLSFLAHAVMDDQYPVVPQAPDYRLGDPAAGRYRRQARLCSQGGNQVGGSLALQLSRTDDRNRRGHFPQAAVSCQTGHDHFLQFQVPEEHIGRIIYFILGCHRCAQAQR